MGAERGAGRRHKGKTLVVNHRTSTIVQVTAVASMAVVLVLLVVQAIEAKHGADRRIGVVFSDSDRGVVVDDVTPGLPAAGAGLAAGDLLVSLNGASLTSLSAYDSAAAELAARQPFQLTIVRDGVEKALRVVPGAPFPGWQLAGNAIVVLLFSAVGLLALFQRADDIRARLLFGFSMAVAVEFALAPTQVSLGGVVPVYAVAGALHLVCGLQIGLLMHLVSVIPDRQPWLARHRWVVSAFYIVGLGLGAVVAVAAAGDVTGVRTLPLPPGVGEDLFYSCVLPAWAIAVAVFLGFQAIRYPHPRGRYQATLVLLGFLPWVFTVIAMAVLSFSGRVIPEWASAAQPLVLMPCPVMVFVAMFRHHLFDIEFIVRRSLVYGALTTTLLLLFYALLGAGGAVFSRLVGGGTSIWLVSGATLTLGLLFAPLRRLLQGIIDRAFSPERYALRESMISMVAALPSLGTLPRMGEYLIGKLCRGLGVGSATLLLAGPREKVLVTLASTKGDLAGHGEKRLLLPRDDEGIRHLTRIGRPLGTDVMCEKSELLARHLQMADVSLAVPIMREQMLIGVLLLGAKVDGSRYVAEELELLSLLAHHVSVVFENVRLFESASYDGLTGLLRREAILEVLEGEVGRAERYGRPLAIGLVDVDHLKLVNDAHGHLAGDGLLQTVAQALSSALRDTDALGRYGGDEFLTVLPETAFEGARSVAEKIRSRLTMRPYRMPDGRNLQATLSIGLATLQQLRGRSALTATELVRLADERLLEAKKGGRDRIKPDPGNGSAGVAG